MDRDFSGASAALGEPSGPGRIRTSVGRLSLTYSPLRIGVTVTLSDVFIRRTSQKRKLSDDELMSRVCDGDEGAFRVLYDRHKTPVFMYCLRMLNDRDTAKDVLQEVFIRIHTQRERYEGGTNFGAWIHTIARNLCYNARRSRKEQTSFDETLGYAMNSSEQHADVGLRDQLADAIAALPEIYREALILREYEDRSYQQIADITGATMSTVKFRIFKAREMLRERLSKSLDDLSDYGTSFTQ